MLALFKTLLTALGITILFNVGDVLIGSRKFLEQPRIHVVQDGEFLSKLAEKYYGNAEYWRALALINRAPNVNRIYPGEHVILPDAGTIARIAKAQRLSEVNELVANQQALAVLESEQEVSEFTKYAVAFSENPEIITESLAVTGQETESFAQQDEAVGALNTESELVNAGEVDALDAFVAQNQGMVENKSSFSGLFWPVAGVAAVLFAGVVYFVRRNKNNLEEETEIDASPIKSFILEEENEKNSKSEDANIVIPAPFSEDIFKPVRRKHESYHEKEVVI